MTAVFTGIYSGDILDDVFAEESASTSTEETHPASALEILVLGVLAILSVLAGYCCRDIFVGLGADAFKNVLAVTEHNTFASAEFLPFTIKMLPTIMSLLVSFEVDAREHQIAEF